jgi:integrase
MYENIDFKKKNIYLEVTKGSKPRTVYISQKTIDLIDKLGVKSGRLFTFMPDGIGNVVKKAIQVAFPMDTEKHSMTPHSLRHSFVTSFIANGGNTIALRHILGWSSLAMLKTYEHLTDNTIQSEYERIANQRGI